MPGNCSFNDVWLQNPKFTKSLQKEASKNKGRCSCVCCDKSYELNLKKYSSIVTDMKSFGIQYNLRAESCSSSSSAAVEMPAHFVL
ncbi:hypothetical protein PR048_011905 [Dryococelus australis]|uniref:Uncharacterized protein n=1 Tax=Dryococelus australis TaxID=614101 RepID=A0ABQ9HMZ8_9NEOP|nr:hypothetical protein PR048_011905 [Dryococelus australis]